jgi:integrase
MSKSKLTEPQCRWHEIDLAEHTWTLPAHRRKTGHQHVVPLSDAAVEILMSLQCEGAEPEDHIFANAAGRPFFAAC